MPENSTQDERAGPLALSDAGVDLLARFAFVSGDDSDDGADVPHVHGDACCCQLRGQ